jgi:hypothetical protein
MGDQAGLRANKPAPAIAASTNEIKTMFEMTLGKAESAYAN